MSKTKQLVFCSLFTALIAVGAFIKIPVPVVPFTLQYLFTMLAGLILGPRLGTISVTAYMLLGLAGLPIFTEGGGLWYVLKPSFGYIIGFCIGTYVTGTLAAKLKKRTFARYLAANLAGLAVVYAAGMIYYYVICNYVLNTPHCGGPAVPILLCSRRPWRYRTERSGRSSHQASRSASGAQRHLDRLRNAQYSSGGNGSKILTSTRR